MSPSLDRILFATNEYFHFEQKNKRLKKRFIMIDSWLFIKCVLNAVILRSRLLSYPRSLEYADCISCIEVTPPKAGVMYTTLNYTWWWGSCSGDLGNMKFHFLAITPRFSLTRSGSVPVRLLPMDQIDQFKNYSYSIGILDIILLSTICFKNSYFKL